MRERACVATLELGGPGGADVKCMSVSEGRLFCGVKSTVVRGDRGSVVAVRVWDLGTMEEAESIRVQTRRRIGESVEVKQLVVDGGQVWARVNDCLVMWRVPERMERLGLLVAGALFLLLVNLIMCFPSTVSEKDRVSCFILEAVTICFVLADAMGALDHARPQI